MSVHVVPNSFVPTTDHAYILQMVQSQDRYMEKYYGLDWRKKYPFNTPDRFYRLKDRLAALSVTPLPEYVDGEPIPDGQGKLTHNVWTNANRILQCFIVRSLQRYALEPLKVAATHLQESYLLTDIVYREPVPIHDQVVRVLKELDKSIHSAEYEFFCLTKRMGMHAHALTQMLRDSHRQPYPDGDSSAGHG